MADISYIQNEELEYSDEAMEGEDEEDVSDNSSSDGRGVWANNTGGGGGGGAGDEGGGDQGFQLTRLEQHATSETIYNRQMVGRILVEIFRTAVDSGTKLSVNSIMQPVQQIIDDPEAAVRSDLVEQLPHVAMICQEAPQMYGDVLRRHLLGIIIKYLRDTDNQVRQSAQAALLVLMERGLLDNNIIEFEVCPVVEFLTYMPVEYLNCGVSLMSKMAPLIGTELTEKAFLDRFITLCKDTTFYVRKICAAHFGEICTAVGRRALFQKLFPTFVDLCWDNIWGVRKACVDVMMPVSCCLTLKHRIMLSELLAVRLNDDSKWVRMSAFQILGPFISTFAKEFTELDYNQYGELVFTNQEGTRFSIRYLYEGILPAKCPVRNQALDAEDYESKDNLSSSITMRKLSWNRLDMAPYYDDEDNDTQKNNAHSTKSSLDKVEKESTGTKSEDVEDVDRYNPFLYYYIPPDLPLDEELIKAAKKSAKTEDVGETVSDEKPVNKTTEPTVPIKPKTEPPKENDNKVEVKNTSNTNARNSNKEVKNNEAEEDDLSFVYLRNSVDTLNDTVDIMNISMEKSGSGTNTFIKRENSKDGGQDIVPQVLIDHFVSMAKPEQCPDMGIEIPHHCAFSFPAVTLTLGRENWHYLKKAYQALAVAKQWKVRRTLATSIHEIAMILGEELTATDLIPIYNDFIKDLDEVRIGVLKHLATFLKILKPTDRCQYLPRLNDFLATDDDWNWRFREELATQLLEAVTLFSPCDVAEHFAPLAFQLLLDKVAAVRHVALTLVTKIVSYVAADEAIVTALIRELRDGLAVNTKKWIQRQTYALLCAQLVSSGAVGGTEFSKELLPSLLNLSWDKVPNVRLAVARTLANYIAPMGANWLGDLQAEEVDRRLNEMRLDTDRDVRVLAGGDEHLSVDALSQNKPEQAKFFVL